MFESVITITLTLNKKYPLKQVIPRTGTIVLPQFLNNRIKQYHKEKQRDIIRKTINKGYQAKDSEAIRRGERINRPTIYDGTTRRSHIGADIGYFPGGDMARNYTKEERYIRFLNINR